MTVERSHLSLEYVRYPVKAKINGSYIDPTNDVVQFAFPVRGNDVASWLAGTWETDASTGVHYARCLIGPGGSFVPGQGQKYDVWIKITDSPEVPARKIDLLVST